MKKALKGKRMRVFVTDGYDAVEMKGVQAFGYKTNVRREGYGEYGSDGDVITVSLFENVTGSIDVRDQNDKELNQARAMMSGRRATDAAGIDFATQGAVWIFKNNYDPDDAEKRKIISSDLVRGALFDEEYKSELNALQTRAFAFQALRGIQFPEHAILFNKWHGDDSEFAFGKPAVQYTNEDGLQNGAAINGYALAVFVNGVFAPEAVSSANQSGLTLSNAYTEDDCIVALTLYDGAM